jgi:two-component system sensor histidine kinase GlrK
MQRFSFRQLLLVAFLLIAVLLGAASLRQFYALQGLLAHSGEQTRAAAARASDERLLAERAVTMERAARQYLVLLEPALRQSYEDAAREAAGAMARLAEEPESAELARRWRLAEGRIQASLRLAEPNPHGAEEALTRAFRDLEGIDAELAAQARNLTRQHSQDLLEELDTSRAQLQRQVLLAVGASVLLALVFGLVLGRPLQRLEGIMVQLGENQLERPIDIHGPKDVRRLGQRLEWLRLRLAELDADKARFLRHVSHDLKTPLAALREGVSLLEDGVAGPLTPPQQEITRILHDNVGTLQTRIEDLLRFNAAAFEARRLLRRPIDLTVLVNEVVADQRLQWQARRLQVEVGKGPVPAEVDPEKLRAALGNLLANAIRFSPPGGTIRLACGREAACVTLDIVDQGPGVAAADRDRIFEPFYRGERQPGDAARGSGIGLSIVHEVVVAHGGRVALAESAAGAHFHIELPQGAD